MIEAALCVCLAGAGFAAGSWLGVRYEAGMAHYLMAGVLVCFAIYLVIGPTMVLNARWISLVAGGYIGLSIGSFLRLLWREEQEEPLPAERTADDEVEIAVEQI